MTAPHRTPAAECGRRCSDWAEPGSAFHWVLADPKPFPAPVPGPGRQRLFHPPAEAVQAAETALAAS